MIPSGEQAGKCSEAQVATRSVVLPLAGLQGTKTAVLSDLQLEAPRSNLEDELLALHPRSFPDASQPKQSTNGDPVAMPAPSHRMRKPNATMAAGCFNESSQR